MKTRGIGSATALFASVLVAGLSAPAFADTTTALPGNPLSVYVGQRGQVQAIRAGSDSGIFYSPSEQAGDAGFFLAFPSGLPGDPAQRVFGFSGSAGPFGLDDYTPVSQSPTTGSGTPSDPYRQVTTYRVNTVLNVTQTTTYINGTQQFSLRWDVHNDSSSTVAFKALFAGDFFFDGSDRGTGIYTDGPPRFIGGTNSDTGNSGGFAEVTSNGSPSWSAYQALEFGSGPDQVWGKIQGAASTTGPTFDNTVIGDPVDNAGGTEWDNNSIAPSATRAFELTVRSAVPSALQLTPTNGGSPKGVPISFTARATNTDGLPYAGRTLRYRITGVNPSAGSVVLGSSGTGTITDSGANAGEDTLVAFVDFNNDGTRQPVEPQASALGTFVDNVDPSCTVKVTGDRPGGGGAGKPLVISVKCDETANVTVATTLQPPRTGENGRNASGYRKVEKKNKIKLKTVRASVDPGQSFPVKLAIPAKVRKKYAGRTLKATTKVTARDSSGNVDAVTATKKIKLARVKGGNAK